MIVIKKISFFILSLLLLFVNINVNAAEIEKINIDNVPIPIIGEKYSDYLKRAKKESWQLNDGFTIGDVKLSSSEVDNTRGIISCAYLSDSTIEYFRGPKGQGFTSGSLTDNDIFEENKDYSCVFEIIPNSEYTISSSLVGNNDSNNVFTNTNNNVLINNIESKLYKFDLLFLSCYNITFNFKPGYKISFVTNTESILFDIYALPNEKINAPKDIVKDNYEFIGWYTNNKYEKEWDFDNDSVKDNMTLYAKWVPYTYSFISGDNQELFKDSIDSYSFVIDGNYNKFYSLKIDNLLLEKDIDYEVVEGSTIINFTTKGLTKLNELECGRHDIVVNYTNDKVVSGHLLISKNNSNNNIVNPHTNDNILLNVIIGSISLISLVGSSLYLKKM